MEEIVIPHSPKWFLTNGLVITPGNGLLYASTYTVVYVHPIHKEKPHSLRIFNIPNRIKALACDPDWTENKLFAVLTENNNLLIFDLDSENPVKGHSVHMQKKTVDHHGDTGAICFTSNKKVYSVDKNIFVNYCVLSNTFVVEKDFLISSKNRISVISASPKRPNLFAAGTRTGLIMICDLGLKQILYNLRGHDTEITSIDWVLVNQSKPVVEETYEKRPKPPAGVGLGSRGAPQDDEIFDIYEFDDLANEFGTIRDTKPLFDESLEKENKEIVGENEHFDFVEACQMLKEDIISSITESDEQPSTSVIRPTADEIREQYQLDSERNLSLHGSENPSRDGFDDFEDEDNEVTARGEEKIKDFIVVSKDELSKIKDDVLVQYIATGSHEPIVWIWDVENGSAVNQIHLKSPKKSALVPETFINVAWINESCLITNTPNGEIVEWTITNLSNKQLMKVKASNRQFDAKAVIALCSSRSGFPFVWAFSIQRELVCIDFSGKSSIVVSNLSTLCPNINYISQCQLDINKIAIACVDKRIGIINVSNLKSNFLPIQSIMNKIQSKVLCVAWHPLQENVIALSTSEGQIAIYDTTKSGNVPIRMKPFCGKPIYALSWGCLTTERISKQNVLFACSTQTGKMVYYSSVGEKKFYPIEINQIQNVSEISCCDNVMAAGTKCGTIYLCNLLDNLSILTTKKISQKYISCISWNPINKNLLAISSMENEITIIDRTSTSSSTDEFKILRGHSSSVASVRWSYNSLNKLVSASYDYSIRVWDTINQTTISIFRGDNLMFAAIFSPLDDNFVIFGGYKITVEIFDTRKYPYVHDETNVAEAITKSSKNKNPNHKFQNTLWAQNSEEKRKSKVELKEEVQKLAQAIQNISVASDDIKPHKNTQHRSGRNTICHITSKEMIRDPVKLIEILLKNGNTDVNIFHKMLFSSRDEVQQVLNNELNNIKTTKMVSPGSVAIPLMMGDLRKEIIECAENKSLTDEHVALSPYISYDFWKKNCKAFAHQCLNAGLTLNALPYLLVCYETSESIEVLCNSNHYREAWIVAKLYKVDGDPIFLEIFEKWIRYLDGCGNYLGAALLNVCNNDLARALELIEKIKNPTEEVLSVIDLIKSHNM